MAYKEEEYRGDIESHPERSLKREIFIIIFGTNTRAGKLFDVILLWLILISVLAVMLETVDFVAVKYGTTLRILEWIVTIFFTIEYVARIAVVQKPAKYILSWLGIIDLLALLPSYLSIILAGSQGLLIIRALRLIRVFRVLKLMRFVSEAEVLGKALKASRHKIIVFFFFLMILVFILGSIMYLVEGPQRGFKSIPLSIYWAIVTLTTVGFGDITPQTVIGQMIASFVMLLGYAIIAIPTGIVGAEIYRGTDTKPVIHKICPNCGAEEHLSQSAYCHTCGEKLIDTRKADIT